MFVILTQQLNSFVAQNWWLEQLAIFMAVVVIWLMVVSYLLVWFYHSGSSKLHHILLTILVIGTVYAINFIIGYCWFEFRPYTIGLTDLLINEPLSAKSFPSDHAAVAFVLAFMFWRLDKRWWLIWPVALLVALARVAVGVHYLHDVLAGAMLGLLISLVVERIYNNSLVRLCQRSKNL